MIIKSYGNITPIKHGTRTAYCNHGCRCEPCREANKKYMVESRKIEKAKQSVVRRFVSQVPFEVVHGKLIRHSAIVALAVLTLAGCRTASKPPLPPLPPLPPQPIRSEIRKLDGGKTNPPAIYVIPWKYPPNKEKFSWDLQSSTNMLTWSTVKVDVKEPLYVTNTGGAVWFRLRGLPL